MGATSNEFSVRDVTTDDVDDVTAVYAHHVRHGTGTFELDAPTTEQMSGRIDDVVMSGLPFLVATGDSGVLGFAYAGPYRTRPAYRHTVEDSIYLAAEATGRGVGTALLETLLARCEAWGARQMVAVIGDSANVASVRLHEKCGFALVGTLRSVGWKHDRWLDTVVMQRALGAGATLPPAPR